MIEVQNLTKRYGPVTAVDDVSFKVERGEILGFAGLVGSGAMPGQVIRATGLQPGGPAMISEGWLRVVPPRTRP